MIGVLVRGPWEGQPEAAQINFLLNVLTDRDISRRMDSLVRASRTGDEGPLLEIGRELEGTLPELFQAMIVERNHDWVPKIVTRVNERPRTLIAVGALHLVGPTNLVDLLSREGFDFKRG